MSKRSLQSNNKKHPNCKKEIDDYSGEETADPKADILSGIKIMLFFDGFRSPK